MTLRAAGAKRYLLGGDYAVVRRMAGRVGGRAARPPGRHLDPRQRRSLGGDRGRPTASRPQRRRELPRDARRRAVAELGALPESAALGHGRARGTPAQDRSAPPSGPSRAPTSFELLEGVADRRLVFGHFHVSFDRIGAYRDSSSSPRARVGLPLDGDHRAAWGAHARRRALSSAGASPMTTRRQRRARARGRRRRPVGRRSSQGASNARAWPG